MSDELTKDHSARRWIRSMVDAKFADRYNIDYDVYACADADYVRRVHITVTLTKKHLVRGQKSRPPITYKVSFENYKDPQAVAEKVATALLLMEQGDDNA